MLSPIEIDVRIFNRDRKVDVFDGVGLIENYFSLYHFKTVRPKLIPGFSISFDRE